MEELKKIGSISRERRPISLYTRLDPASEIMTCNVCGRVFQSEYYCILHIKNDHHEKISLTTRVIR